MPSMPLGRLRRAVFRSDHGAKQFESMAFAAACSQVGARQSMTKIGSSADTCLAESFNATLSERPVSSRGLRLGRGRCGTQ